MVWLCRAIAYPIIMNSVGILVTGVMTNAFRTPMIWLALGAGACFIAWARQSATRERWQHRGPMVPSA